jgi:alkaline phosphatase D
MQFLTRKKAAITRRRFLTRSASAAILTGFGSVAAPYLSRAADRPLIAGGIQSGDVSDDSAVVWARADRPSRMRVDFSTVESFNSILSADTADALPNTDFTAKLLARHLPPGQDIFYRVRFHDIAEPAIAGEAQVGHFRTAPADNRSVSFTWSGDTAGQGWGIDLDRGGMRTWRTVLDNRPDFFIHSGDSIYADCPIERELNLPGGEIWRNVVTEEKSEIARTLAQFRGNYKYNLLDEHQRAFNAEVPIFAQWDDHEVTNDWSPEGTVDAAGYAPDGQSRLVARACRAFHEFMPTRPMLAEAGRHHDGEQRGENVRTGRHDEDHVPRARALLHVVRDRNEQRRRSFRSVEQARIRGRKLRPERVRAGRWEERVDLTPGEEHEA